MIIAPAAYQLTPANHGDVKVDIVARGVVLCGYMISEKNIDANYGALKGEVPEARLGQW
jgi:hypothetical protein